MKKNKLLLTLILILQIYSCESFKKGMGIQKNSPNEFLVEKKNSIVLPPDHELLAPDYKKLEEKKNLNNNQDLITLIDKEIDLNSQINKSYKYKNIDQENQDIENQILKKIK